MEHIEKKIQLLLDEIVKEIRLEASLVGMDHIVSEHNTSGDASVIRLDDLSIWFNKEPDIELEIEGGEVTRISNKEFPNLLTKLIQAYTLNGKHYIKPS